MADSKISGGQWNIMRELWKEAPQTLMQLVGKLEKSVGWSKSTTITTLHRMERKGIVSVEQVGRSKSYAPLITEEEATISETRSFLDRVYSGSVGLMVSAMAERQELSDDELAELRRILHHAEEQK